VLVNKSKALRKVSKDDLTKEYQSVMQSTTGEIDAMNKNHHTSDEEEFDPENQKMFESQVIEERDILVESNDFNSSTMESEDPKEKAVNHIRGLFKKLKLLTEVDDYKKILDYYYNGEERNEQLYETLIAKEKELEEEAIKAREFEEILKDLRKKEKTNQDHIKEDIEGYQLSVHYILIKEKSCQRI